VDYFSRKALALGCLIGVFGLNARAMDDASDGFDTAAEKQMSVVIREKTSEIAAKAAPVVTVVSNVVEGGMQTAGRVAAAAQEAAKTVQHALVDQEGMGQASPAAANAVVLDPVVAPTPAPNSEPSTQQAASAPQEQQIKTPEQQSAEGSEQKSPVSQSPQEGGSELPEQPVLPQDPVKPQQDQPQQPAQNQPATPAADKLSPSEVAAAAALNTTEGQDMIANFLAWIKDNPGKTVGGVVITAATIYGVYKLWKAEFAQKYKKLAAKNKKKVACGAAVTAVAAGLLLNHCCGAASVVAATTSVAANK
jgi:hypothetical protein